MKKLVKWIAFDGLLHLETSALIVIAVSVLVPWWGGAIAAAVAGVTKEVIDRKRGGPFSGHDLICDAAGIALGVAVVVCAFAK